MNVRNCKRCGKMFNYIQGLPICQSCREEIEKKFQEVKDYVHEHKTATMDMIQKDCGVERKQIEQWVREERLVFSDESPIKLFCESCGKQIATGRFCAECKKDTASGLSAAGKREEAPRMESKKDAGSKMYTFKKNS